MIVAHEFHVTMFWTFCLNDDQWIIIWSSAYDCSKKKMRQITGSPLIIPCARLPLVQCGFSQYSRFQSRLPPRNGALRIYCHFRLTGLNILLSRVFMCGEYRSITHLCPLTFAGRFPRFVVCDMRVLRWYRNFTVLVFFPYSTLYYVFVRSCRP